MPLLGLRRIVLLLVFLLGSAALHAEEPVCAIVYGKTWAFSFAAPDAWNTACPVNDPSGIVVALWPEGTPWDDAPGIMYATVNEKNGFSLAQFADDELARFRQQSPQLQVEMSEPIVLPNKAQALVRKLTGDRYGNHEIIAYADVGTVYLILVLTSGTEEEFERLRPAFAQFVSSVIPMKIEFGSAEEAPGPAHTDSPEKQGN